MRFAFATIATGAIAAGGCLGGLVNAYDKFLYDSALNSPDFLYLVDQNGNPVSQEIYQPLN